MSVRKLVRTFVHNRFAVTNNDFSTLPHFIFVSFKEESSHGDLITAGASKLGPLQRPCLPGPHDPLDATQSPHASPVISIRTDSRERLVG